jgi:hypothetical protein
VRLSFQLTSVDYDAFHADYYRTSPEGRRAMRVGRWVIPVVGVLVLMIPLSRFGYDPIWIPVMLGYIVGWVFAFPKLLAWRSSRMNRRLQKLDPGATAFAPREVEVLPEGIHGQAGVASTRLEWGAIRRYSRGPEHLFLYLDARQALILPRRACASDSDFEALAEICIRQVPSEAAR